MLTRDPSTLDAFVEPARERAEFWRLGLTVLLAILLFSIVLRSVFALIGHLAGPLWNELILRALETGRTPFGVAIGLYTFLPLGIALALALRLLHDRSWTSLLGPLRLAARSMAWVGASLILLQLALMPFDVLSGDAGRHLRLDQQLPWVLPALIGILVQAGTEEALFRGYLLQQLAARSRNPLIWMVLPSILFALMHIDNAGSGIGMAWALGHAFLFGLAASDITARTGTLGPAIGMHIATNVGAILMVGISGRMDGLAAWNLVLDWRHTGAILPHLGADMIFILISWVAARLIMRV